MRNPWAREKYYGPWSDNHTNAAYSLTDADLLELDHEKGNDGFFWMAVEDYHAYTSYTSMNYDVDNHNWHHGYHLTLDDDETGSRPGEWTWCGPSCTRYTGVVVNTSNVYNKIHPGVHTWRWRSYAETTSCDQNTGNSHAMKEDGTRTAYGFRNGERWLRVVNLAPGDQITYTIELDLNKTGMSKDWAFTAWGEDGTI